MRNSGIGLLYVFGLGCALATLQIGSSSGSESNRGVRVGSTRYATLEAAYSALPSGGGTIWVPPNTTVKSGTVDITKDNVTIQCASRTTSILQQQTLGNPLIRVGRGVKDFSVTDCNFLGAGPGERGASSNEAILLNSGGSRVHIRRNRFSRWQYWAIRAVTCDDCWVEDNEWKNSWGGLVLWQGGSHLHTINNSVHDPPSDAYFIAPVQIDTAGAPAGGGAASHAEFIGGRFYNLVNGEALTIHTCNHCVIDHPVMGNVLLGIGIGGVQAGDTCNDVVVRAPVYHGATRNTGQTAANEGIEISGAAEELCTHVTVENANIDHANAILRSDSLGGIGINHAEDVNIMGGVVRNSCGNGIVLAGTQLKRVSIKNTQIKNLRNSTEGRNRGVYVASESAGITGQMEGLSIRGVQVGIGSDAANTGLLLGDNDIKHATNVRILNPSNFGSMHLPASE